MLNIQNANALGTTAAGTTVASGAALQIQGGITTAAEALTLNGTGVANDGTLRNVSGNNTYAGAISLASAARINSDGGTLTVSPITTANNALTIGGSGNTTISASFGSDLKTFTKDGSGLLTVNGSLWVGYISGAGATLSNGTLNVTERDDRLPAERQFHARQRNERRTLAGLSTLAASASASATGDYWQNGGQNTVGTLYFGGGSPAPGGTYHLAGGTLTAGAINQGSSGAAAVVLSGGTLQASSSFISSVPLSLNSASTIDTQSYSPTLSGTLSGSGLLNKIGSGTLILAGSNSYSGATTVTPGCLNIQIANALGTTAAGTTVSSGAALQIQGGITTTAEALTLNGMGVANNGALRNVSDNNTYAGNITLGQHHADQFRRRHVHR